MWREPTPHPRPLRDPPELRADAGRGPRSAARRSIYDAEQRTDRHRPPSVEPWRQLLPGPIVHPYLTTLAALATADQHRPTAAIEVGLCQCERFPDPQPRAPHHDDERTQPQPSEAAPSRAHDGDDLLH